MAATARPQQTHRMSVILSCILNTSSELQRRFLDTLVKTFSHSVTGVPSRNDAVLIHSTSNVFSLNMGHISQMLTIKTAGIF